MLGGCIAYAGLQGPLYFIQRGELNREALDPVYQNVMPPQKTAIRFKWRARKTQVRLSVVCARRELLACLLSQRVLNIDKEAIGGQFDVGDVQLARKVLRLALL